MPANLQPSLPYESIRLEGGLFVPELIERAVKGGCDYQSPADYHIPKGTQLHDEYGRAFKIARAQWKEFAPQIARTDITVEDLATRTEAFVLEFLRDVLAYDDLASVTSIAIDDYAYPVALLDAKTKVPVVVAPASQDLTAADERFAVQGGGARRKSAVQLMQEFLNASHEYTWGFVTNGRSLRLLRDSSTLTRPCYLEVDIETILQDDVYHEFKALWMLLQASRALPVKDGDCVWECWRDAGHKEGIRVREGLRVGVKNSLEALGAGFLQHPANRDLCRALDDGSLSREEYFEQLLRLVYRFIFLFTAEERGLLHPPDDSPEAVTARALYAEGYAMRRLSERALRRQGFDEYHDIWHSIQIVMRALRNGESRLALPALGGLFAEDQCAGLENCLLTNRVVLTVMRHLRWSPIQGALTRVDYRNMGPEELGSVYESLLELDPEVDPTTGSFAFPGLEDDASTAGNKRKTTGSYYTPDSLVQELIESALDPVIAARLEAHPDSPEEALLSISVVDPACGSGHFLLSAARRLAEHLAPLRSTDGSLHDEDYRVALRDVVSHCIYGVDRNRLALELARTALWLEGYEPGRPLSFLEHHLVHGDALLGLMDFNQLRSGIPSDAFKPLSGDERKVCRELARTNNAQLKAFKSAIKGQKELFDQEERENIFKQMEELDALPDDTPEDVQRKSDAYTAFLVAARNSHLAHTANLFVGAFLVPKDSEDAAGIAPTTAALQHELAGSGTPATPAMREAVSIACEKAHVLHWPLAFPHIFGKGGFDCVLANPPWERIKLQEQEYFATRCPPIAEAKNKAEREKRIDWLSEGILASNLDPDAHAEVAVSDDEKRRYQEFITEKRRAEALSIYAHLAGKDGGRFPLTGTGDVNTYALFGETISCLVAVSGYAGFIVPTGIATDDSTKAFFVDISQSRRLVSLFDFENRKKLFPEVDSRVKFCLITLGTAEQVGMSFYLTDPEELDEDQRRFFLDPNDIERMNPNTRTCPIFRTEMDAELTRKIYQKVPVLIREARDDGPEVNPWGVRFFSMFHMSNDSHLFVDADKVSSEGAPSRSLLPLYEAKMIHQFDHRWGTYVYDDGNEGIMDVPVEQKSRPDFVVRPRYYVEDRQVLARIANVPAPFANAYAAEKWDDLLLALANWIEVSELKQQSGGQPFDEQLKLIVGGDEQLGLFATDRTPILQRYRILKENKDGIELPDEWRDTKLLASAATCPLEASELSMLEGNSDLKAVVDKLMDERSPQWLMGWRRNARSNDERTTICSLIPRAGVGDSLFLMRTRQVLPNPGLLLGNLNSLVFDFVARQKLGGVNFSYYYMEQLPVLPPDRYTATDSDYVIPRVLELTYTAQDIAPWAEGLGHTGPPFPFDPPRRAQLGAELDAYYARLYGLTRDELRYILDPADVMGLDYPSETFRVLKNSEIKEFGEYRTQRLVLEAWDAQEREHG